MSPVRSNPSEPYWYTITSHPWSDTVLKQDDMWEPKLFHVSIHGETLVVTQDEDYAYDVYNASYDISTQGDGW